MSFGKKIFTIIIILMFIVALGFLGFWHIIQAKKMSPVFYVSGHPQWAPIMWQYDNQIIGVGPELAANIFNDLGLPFEIKYAGDWEIVQKQMKAGSLDVLVAAYKNAERENFMAYSDAYTVDPISLFVLSGRELKFEKWEDLIGKRGVAMTGDSYGQQFDDFIEANLDIVRVVTAEEAFALLNKNKADYFVYALYSGQNLIKENQWEDKYEVLPKYVASENFYLTISKKSPLVDYLPRINELIATYKADGTIDQLIDKYQNLP